MLRAIFKLKRLKIKSYIYFEWGKFLFQYLLKNNKTKDLYLLLPMIRKIEIGYNPSNKN